MKLHKLYQMQRKLDQHIEEKHGLLGEDLISRKVLALLVEIGELANETRCFKFWSVKEPSAREVILEEFVDGVHFLLSLGIACGFEIELNVPEGYVGDRDVTEQFLTIYRCAGLFQVSRDLSSYQQLFTEYFTLATMLGFTAQQVQQAYISKNEVNYKRQEQGY